MKRINFFFSLSLWIFFWNCRSTKLLRLFSGNLPAMLLIYDLVGLPFGRFLFCRLLRLCFFNSSSPSMILTTWHLGIDFFNDFSDFYCFALKICVLDVISVFRSIAWLTSLKNDFWTHLRNFKFSEYLPFKGQKINSVHLSSAKLICLSSWALVFKFFDFEYQFWKCYFRAFSS